MPSSPSSARALLPQLAAFLQQPGLKLIAGHMRPDGDAFGAALGLARTLTLCKPCCEESQIPVHMNVGMGVGGVPMAVRAPVDAVSRAARACVDILKVDGL